MPSGSAKLPAYGWSDGWWLWCPREWQGAQVEGAGAGNVSEAQEDISCFAYLAVIVLQQHHRLHHVPEHHHGHAEHG